MIIGLDYFSRSEGRKIKNKNQERSTIEYVDFLFVIVVILTSLRGGVNGVVYHSSLRVGVWNVL